LKFKQLKDTGSKGEEAGEAGPLDEVEAEVQRLRFDAVNGESPDEIGGEEEAKGGAFRVRAAVVAMKGEGEQGKEEDLVKLGGMTGNAIAEVDSPGEVCRGAVGVVGEAGEEAADAADGDADAKRNGEEVSGAGVDVLEALDELDGEPATEKSANDGLAAGQEEVSPSELREGDDFEKTEEARAEQGTDGCGSDDEPTTIVGEESPRRSRERR
jgi:hypothetical protein